MLKRMLILTLALVLPIFCAISAQASVQGENRGDLKLAAEEMKLDGEMDDSYTNGFKLKFDHDSAGNTYDEPIARAWMVWEQTDSDRDYLWCYVEIEDMSFSGGGSEFYMRDSVELFLNFSNSDEKSDVYQHIADVEGNAKEWSDSSDPGRDIVANGLNGEITTVADESGEYFSCVVLQKEFYYTVEYRVSCEKLEIGQEIAYSMQTHDYPGGSWYFCEASLLPSNWDPTSYDYVIVSDEVVVPETPATRPPEETLPFDTEIIITDMVITDPPAETPPAQTAPGTDGETDGAAEEKSGCGSALGSLGLIALLAIPALKRRRR